MDLAAELRESLLGMLASGSIEIREATGRTSPLPPLSLAIRDAADKPLLHLWAENYAYFSDIELPSAAPLVYLIAPALRFHPTPDALLQYLSPDMEIIRIGLAETWRRGLRVVMRQ